VALNFDRAAPSPENPASASSHRIAGWAEIAKWCRDRGLTFDGNVTKVNYRRKAEGRKPFAIACGPIQRGLRS
jgi:hypothetical protein